MMGTIFGALYGPRPPKRHGFAVPGPWSVGNRPAEFAGGAGQAHPHPLHRVGVCGHALDDYLSGPGVHLLCPVVDHRGFGVAKRGRPEVGVLGLCPGLFAVRDAQRLAGRRVRPQAGAYTHRAVVVGLYGHHRRHRHARGRICHWQRNHASGGAIPLWHGERPGRIPTSRGRSTIGFPSTSGALPRARYGCRPG